MTDYVLDPERGVQKQIDLSVSLIPTLKQLVAKARKFMPNKPLRAEVLPLRNVPGRGMLLVYEETKKS